MKILTAEEMRQVDRLTTERYGIPGLTLMENAGAGVARFIAQRWPDFAQRRIIVLCGKGNNGGDGFVAARHLRDLGAKPDVYLLAATEEMRGDAATNCKRWQETYGELHVIRDASAWQTAKATLSSAQIVVDAILGTGTRGPVAGLLAEVIEAGESASRASALCCRCGGHSFRTGSRHRRSRWARRPFSLHRHFYGA